MTEINGHMTTGEIERILIRIEKKLDSMDGRVDTLEIWRASIMGKLSLMAAFVSIGFTVGIDYLRQKLGR